jgi:hypothetical protein
MTAPLAQGAANLKTVPRTTRAGTGDGQLLPLLAPYASGA